MRLRRVFEFRSCLPAFSRSPLARDAIGKRRRSPGRFRPRTKFPDGPKPVRLEPLTPPISGATSTATRKSI